MDLVLDHGAITARVSRTFLQDFYFGSQPPLLSILETMVVGEGQGSGG